MILELWKSCSMYKVSFKVNKRNRIPFSENQSIFMTIKEVIKIKHKQPNSNNLVIRLLMGH